MKRHPSIADLVGYDRRTSVITFVVVGCQIGLAYAFSYHARLGTWFGSLCTIALVALFVGSIFAHWAAVAIHEATHHLVAKTPLGNRCLALVANFHVLVPSAMPFWRHHMRHHTFLGVEGIDNDLPQNFEVRFIRTPLRKAVWLTFYVAFAVFGRGFWNRPNRWEWVNIGLQLMVNLALFQWLGGVGIAYLALSVFFGFGLHPVAGHFVHEHYRWSPEQETYSYYGVLNGVNLNIGYHFEHHDFPKVPGARLPRLHSLAPEYYQTLVCHRSWLQIYWTFITDSSLGHHSRFIRSKETFIHARKELRSRI